MKRMAAPIIGTETTLFLNYFISKVLNRHVPGSQPPSSLIPDPDQNQEDATIISVVDYGVYIPISHPIHCFPLPNQNFEKMPKILQILRNPGSRIRVGFLPICMGFKSFHQRNSPSYKTLQHGQSGAMLRSTVDHHALPELTFKDKTPQGMERVWF